ncbi:MAG: T9SS type A sorting domain-containing protein [Saprospiraceae bacterium]|nr:T9SS type A sorting domain-containing protein [Saprospiraceae bacterium]MBP7699405.1 T9SS type A sorting domain-containing protein [Saprospiraceae bacterium]
MKKLFTILYLCGSIWSNAQITVSANTLPAAGDTLTTSTILQPSGISLGTTGGNQTWNWSSLNLGVTRNEVYLAAGEGTDPASFPTANLVVKSFGADIAETYYSTSNGKLELIGYKGTDPLGFGLPLSVLENPTRIVRNLPLTSTSASTNVSNIVIAFDDTQLPDTLLSQFPITPDSIRIRVQLTRTENVDAWGTMNFASASYPVLRQKRTDVQDTKVEAKVPVLGWIDVTAAVPSNPFLGINTTVSYIFYNNIEKTIIAEAVVDSTNAITSVEAYSKGLTVGTNDNQYTEVMTLFPNPVSDILHFRSVNIPSGNYTLQVYSVLGELMSTTSHTLTANNNVRVPIQLANGHYYAIWRNAKNDKVSAHTFIVQQ